MDTIIIKKNSVWGTTMGVLLLLLLAAAGGLYVYRDSLCDRFQSGWQEAHLFYLQALWKPQREMPPEVMMYEMRVEMACMRREMANELARLMAEQERLRKQSGQPEQNPPWPNAKSNVRTVKQFPYGTATEQK